MTQEKAYFETYNEKLSHDANNLFSYYSRLSLFAEAFSFVHKKEKETEINRPLKNLKDYFRINFRSYPIALAKSHKLLSEGANDLFSIREIVCCE